MDVYPGALLLAILLAGHGLRKGSLALSGALAAMLVGYTSLASPLRSCGATLIAFYLLGSQATKVGHEIKAQLETEDATKRQGPKGRGFEGEKENKHKAQSGGQRTATQVLCNSLVGAMCALLARLLYGDLQNLIGRGTGTASLAADTSSPTSWLAALCRPQALFFAMLGHYACCMGDTLASEFGILAPGTPRLILPPFPKVPRGTNGGVSRKGTGASVFGGMYIGLVASMSYMTIDDRQALGSVRDFWLFPALSFTMTCICIGAAAGLMGSAIDSILGATLQRTWYNERRNKVLIGRLPSEAKSKVDADVAEALKEWKVLTGHDILSNSAVNFASSVMTALGTAIVGARLFPEA